MSTPVSVEEIQSDSDDEDNVSRSNSPIIPARSLGMVFSICCFQGIKVCFLIFLLLFAAVISQPMTGGRESSKKSFAKRWASKAKSVTPLVMPSLEDSSKKRKATAPLAIKKESKRRRADVLDKDFASSNDDSVNVVWPEMQHLLNGDVFEEYKSWDLEDVVNEAGANTYKVSF